MDGRAIGIFDSGQGGLTVVRELLRVCPTQKIIYFGDTARVPYGTKSVETVVRYAKEDIEFLKSKDVKMIIAACGTVSSNLNDNIVNELGVRYIGVVEPAIKRAVELTKTNKIVVLGTPATIKSGSFEKGILKYNKKAQIKSIACPMFVPLVENGYVEKDNLVANLIAREYFEGLKGENYDVIILGCTHFPLLANVIKKNLPDNVTLINPAQETVVQALDIMEKEGINTVDNKVPQHEFYFSDEIFNFDNSARAFLKDVIESDKLNYKIHTV